MKIDVEGSEFPLFDHLLSTGAAGLIDELFVEVAMCIKNDEVCTKNDEFCTKNDELCIKVARLAVRG